MPGRVAAAKSTRNARNLSPNSSIQIPDEGADSSLRRAICTTFADAQRSISAHRKAIIALRKVQEACCYEQKEDFDYDEDDFTREVVRCVVRILPVKKAEAVGDLAVRFVGSFLNVASGKDSVALADDDDDDNDGQESPTSRLTTSILETLLPLLQTKDKAVRFRATQIVSHVVNSVDTVDDSLFHRLRVALLKRIHDKEAPVRLQAVYGLGRLATEVEDDDEQDDSDSENDAAAAGVLGKLLGVLQNDPSADVRRNLLLNLPLTKEVLPYLLERARDADATTRRALYARLLPALGDFRHLSLTHREKLLRWGLRDRDEKVREATAKLFRERWIEDCAALPAAQAEEGEQKDHTATAAPPSLDALLELLERIDVVNSGTEGGIALIAMREFWRARDDYLAYVSFPPSFWEDLSPELAFVARTFNDYCRSPTGKDAGVRESLVEEKLPEVSQFGHLLQGEIRRLMETTFSTLSQDAIGEADEEELAHREFIVEQMLHMALTFDYSDEVGRRKMFALMRESLALPDLPEEVTRLVVEVLRLVCGEDAKGEREFCGVVLEAIAEVHDTIMGDQDDEADSTNESFHSATEDVDPDTIVLAQKQHPKRPHEKEGGMDEAEEAVREIMVNMKCLHIALCMLQNVQGDLEENVHLVTMLNNLVVPAVRSQEAPIRERGLVCLGLCCLLGKNLAQENLTLFLHCFAKGHPALQSIALQIITDILITHPSLLSPAPLHTSTSSSTEEVEILKPILKTFHKALKSSSPAVQATGAGALSKAFLSQLITDTDLLKQLVVTYFDPDSADNAQLRQNLAYFLPVYCHSRSSNAERMAEIACGVVARLFTLRESYMDDDGALEVDEGGEKMVKMGVLGGMLVDWTDDRKILDLNGSTAGPEGDQMLPHFILGEAILERLVTAAQVGKEEKKVLFAMLGKLHLPCRSSSSSGGGGRAVEVGMTMEQIKTLLELAQECVDGKVAADATSKNILTKVQNGLLKGVHDGLSAERGGGGGETEVEEVTEIFTELGVDNKSAKEDGEEEEEEDEEEESQANVDEQLLREMSITLGGGGANTLGPDAEGTRLEVYNNEDTDMMDLDG